MCAQRLAQFSKARPAGPRRLSEKTVVCWNVSRATGSWDGQLFRRLAFPSVIGVSLPTRAATPSKHGARRI
jgi:hypothetical protein